MLCLRQHAICEFSFSSLHKFQISWHYFENVPKRNQKKIFSLAFTLVISMLEKSFKNQLRNFPSHSVCTPPPYHCYNVQPAKYFQVILIALTISLKSILSCPIQQFHSWLNVRIPWEIDNVYQILGLSGNLTISL